MAAQAGSPAGGIAADGAAAYMLLLENALLPASPSELHAAALGALLAVAAAQPAPFAAAFALDRQRQQLLLRLLGHVDASARQAAAQLLGMLVPHLSAPQVGALCDELLSTLRVGSAEGAKAAKLEQLDGAAAAAGYVAAHLLQGERLVQWSGPVGRFGTCLP